MNNSPVTVLSVDDDPSIGESLARWLKRSEGFRFVGFVQDPALARGMILSLHPDVVLMDLEVGGFDVPALLGDLATSHPTVHIAVYSASADLRAVRRCLDAGACGFLSKDEAPAELAAAVRQIANGQRVLSPALREAAALNSLRALT